MRRVAGVVVLGVLVAGCGGGSREGESVATSMPAPSSAVEQVVTSSTSSTRVPSEEEAVLAAVQGYWNAVLAANNPPDPDHPDLVRYASGEALDRARANAASRKQLGQAVRLPVDSVSRQSASLVSMTDSEAVVSACVVDDGVVYDVASGLVLNDAVITYQFELTLSLIDRMWKVTSNRTTGEWGGVAACAG